MRGISVRQPWAAKIATGEHSVEKRAFRVNVFGPIVICASPIPDASVANVGFPVGCTICVVDIVEITGERGAYLWHLANPRWVENAVVAQTEGIFEVPDELILFVEKPSSSWGLVRAARRVDPQS